MGSVLVNVTCIGKNWFFFQSEHQLTVKIPLRNDVDFINSSTFFFSGSPSYLGVCHEHNDFLTLKMKINADELYGEQKYVSEFPPKP